MNETISNLAAELKAAITGTRPTPKDPTENSAKIICSLALDEIKKLSGLQDYLDGEEKCVALQHDLNFVLVPGLAERLYQQQFDSHSKLASTGKSLSEIDRGRDRESWVQDVASRKSAAENASLQLSGKLQPFRKRISDICVATLIEQCASLMLAESKLGAAYGLIYTESPALKKLRALQNYIQWSAPAIVTKLLK
jgi:hypothetical protein